MDKRQALRASAGLAMLSWLALLGCGMGGSGCGGTNPQASTPPNCSQGTYAKQNSDGTYGPCQPIPGQNNAPAGNTSNTSTYSNNHGP